MCYFNLVNIVNVFIWFYVVIVDFNIFIFVGLRLFVNEVYCVYYFVNVSFDLFVFVFNGYVLFFVLFFNIWVIFEERKRIMFVIFSLVNDFWDVNR